MKIFDCPRCGERRNDSGMLGDTGVCLICAEAELKRLRGIEKAVWPPDMKFTREDMARLYTGVCKCHSRRIGGEMTKGMRAASLVFVLLIVLVSSFAIMGQAEIYRLERRIESLESVLSYVVYVVLPSPLEAK